MGGNASLAMLWYILGGVMYLMLSDLGAPFVGGNLAILCFIGGFVTFIAPTLEMAYEDIKNKMQ